MQKSLTYFEKAMDRFTEAIEEPESSIVMDATIQRFEFTYELMWKTLKIFLEDIHGIRTVSPRQVFKEAYSLSIVEQEELFLEMIKSRNYSPIPTMKNKLLIFIKNALHIYQRCKMYMIRYQLKGSSSASLCPRAKRAR